MQQIRSAAQEAAEDVFFGQVVIIWARWFLIVAGIILALWTADNETQIVVGIVPVVVLMGLNFYLHSRYLTERPANRALITVASIMDIAIITAVVLLWPGQRGFENPFFILYYPVVLAFAFVMPPRVTIGFTLAVLGTYAAACLVTDAAFIAEVSAIKTLLLRVITLGAMGGLGAYHWRIQRSRRRAAMGQMASIEQ